MLRINIGDLISGRPTPPPIPPPSYEPILGSEIARDFDVIPAIGMVNHDWDIARGGADYYEIKVDNLSWSSANTHQFEEFEVHALVFTIEASRNYLYGFGRNRQPLRNGMHLYHTELNDYGWIKLILYKPFIDYYTQRIWAMRRTIDFEFPHNPANQQANLGRRVQFVWDLKALGGPLRLIRGFRWLTLINNEKDLKSYVEFMSLIALGRVIG